MILRLAWRNIWHQPRRTLITAGAIAMALMLALFMRSMQEGSYANNLDNATRFYAGMMQLQHKEFRENQSIDKLLSGSLGFIASIANLDGISAVIPRLESFALGAAGDKSKGVLVMGIDPPKEDTYSNLSRRLVAGNYLSSDMNSVLVGQSLARYLSLAPGDELVLYGQGYRGNTAAGLYRVQGIVKLPNPQLDARLVYLPLSAAQDLFSTGNQLTAWVLHGEDFRLVTKLKQNAINLVDNQVAVLDWQELAPELAQQIALDRAGGQFLVVVLYGVVGFGLFATIAMMTLERQREFAVMIATGMTRLNLKCMLVLESCFITLLGIIMGLVIITPVLIYFYFNPIQLTGEIAAMMEEMGFEAIIPFSLAPELVVSQISGVFLITLVCLVFPLVKAHRLALASGLKGG